MWKQKEPRSVTHGREAHSIVLARVWGRFGSAQRVPTGQGEAGALAKLKADRGAHWSNEEPKDCPVPQECNSPPPSHTQAPRTNPVGHSPSGEDLLSLSLVSPMENEGSFGHSPRTALPLYSHLSTAKLVHTSGSSGDSRSTCLLTLAQAERNKVSMVWRTVLLGWFLQSLSQRPKALLNAVKIKNNLQPGRFCPSCWRWMQ